MMVEVKSGRGQKIYVCKWCGFIFYNRFVYSGHVRGCKNRKVMERIRERAEKEAMKEMEKKIKEERKEELNIVWGNVSEGKVVDNAVKGKVKDDIGEDDLNRILKVLLNYLPPSPFVSGGVKPMGNVSVGYGYSGVPVQASNGWMVGFLSGVVIGILVGVMISKK